MTPHPAAGRRRKSSFEDCQFQGARGSKGWRAGQLGRLVGPEPRQRSRGADVTGGAGVGPRRFHSPGKAGGACEGPDLAGHRRQTRKRQKLAEQRAQERLKRPGDGQEAGSSEGHARYGNGKDQAWKTQPRKGEGKTGKPRRTQASRKGKGKGKAGPDGRPHAHAKQGPTGQGAPSRPRRRSAPWPFTRPRRGRSCYAWRSKRGPQQVRQFRNTSTSRQSAEEERPARWTSCPATAGHVPRVRQGRP